MLLHPLDLTRFPPKVALLDRGICVNRLYYGDNLEVLRGFAEASVDLVYLDPPFNSNAGYNVLFKEFE